MNFFSHFKKSRNIYIYLISFAASAVGIGLNFFLAKVLEAEYFGRVQYLVALATTCSQLLIFGLNMFLIREAKNEKQGDNVFNKCISLYLAIILFFAPIVFFVLNKYIPTTLNDSLMSATVLAVSIMMGFNTLIAAYHQGSGKYHLSVIFENFIPKFFLLITAIIFMVIGRLASFQENYLLYYLLCYSIICIPFLIVLFRRINFSFDKGELQSIFFFFGVTVTYSLGNNLTKVLQGGLYQNNIALGIISVSISIISLIKVFTAVLDNLIKPIFAKKKREKDYDGLLNCYQFETRVNMYVAIPLYLFFVFNPSRFLSIFGDSYLQYPNILMIIALANAANDITGSNGTLLAMTGKEKWELLNGIVYFAVYFISIFVFSSDKIYGLSYALLVSQIAVNVLKYVEVWLIYKRTPLDSKTIISFFIIIALNFAAIFSLRFVNFGLLIWILIGAVIGILLVVLNFFVFSLYRKEDFKRLIGLKL